MKPSSIPMPSPAPTKAPPPTLQVELEYQGRRFAIGF
jgi:hypothetical protein